MRASGTIEIEVEALGKVLIGLQANVNYHNVAMGQGQDSPDAGLESGRSRLDSTRSPEPVRKPQWITRACEDEIAMQKLELGSKEGHWVRTSGQ